MSSMIISSEESFDLDTDEAQGRYSIVLVQHGVEECVYYEAPGDIQSYRAELLASKAYLACYIPVLGHSSRKSPYDLSSSMHFEPSTGESNQLHRSLVAKLHDCAQELKEARFRFTRKVDLIHIIRRHLKDVMEDIGGEYALCTQPQVPVDEEILSLLDLWQLFPVMCDWVVGLDPKNSKIGKDEVSEPLEEDPPIYVSSRIEEVICNISGCKS
ncbi:hypothetical protein V866_001050 [Kwoniella sp. B9012]|uniref:Uncharacterized protein n=1 Tax=Kwoniella europaea PYCC6329 TaxID=1423913 RepID=A0AAX4K949_9TREE